MIKLKNKLKAMAIYNSAVCNCHSNDEFTPLIKMVENGYLFVNKTASNSERITFGHRLRLALKKFTKKFVPHMKEEEEIFQPLLLEYFTQEELAEMKNIVIKLHLQRRKDLTNNQCSNNNNNRQQFKYEIGEEEKSDWIISKSITNLPNEILLKIFAPLDLKHKFNAAQVCKKWNNIIYDKTCWRELSFSQWKKTSTFF